MKYTGMVTYDSKIDLYGAVIFRDNDEYWKTDQKYGKNAAIEKLEKKMKGLGVNGEALEQFIH